MKTLTCFVLLFVLFALGAGPDRRLHNRCLYPVVIIRPVDDAWTGTGCVTRSAKRAEGRYLSAVLGCAHVAGDGDQGSKAGVYHYEDWSRQTGRDFYHLAYYAMDRKRDLAVALLFSKIQLPTAEMDWSDCMWTGDDLFRIGCGLGGAPRLDYGKLTGWVRDGLRTSVHTVPGDSGAPVFRNYRLVGVMRAVDSFDTEFGTQIATGVSFATPVKKLADWNKELGGGLSFAWGEGEWPKMPQYRLDMTNRYAIDLPDGKEFQCLHHFPNS